MFEIINITFPESSLNTVIAQIQDKGFWSGDVTVELHPNKEAPFHLLPVVKNVKSFYWEADFALVPGVIVRDFLKEQSNE